MTTIIINKENIHSQGANMQNLVNSGEYNITLTIEPEEISLAQYVKTSKRLDPSYGTFTTAESLFSSLDA